MLETTTSIVDVDVPALLEDSTGPYQQAFANKSSFQNKMSLVFDQD
jgi:hypothetical protein